VKGIKGLEWRIRYKINSLNRYLASHPGKFLYIGHGRHRDTYLHKRCVIKVARCIEGIQANNEELDIFRSRDKKNDKIEGIEIVRYARCRRFNEVAIVMESIVEFDFSKGHYVPNWAWDMDGGQVGWNRKCRLVAYDYSIV
jgi:hypothetical protein